MRNTLKYVADKDRKPFTTDLKTIYQAPTEEGALEALERVTEKWSEKYPNSMKSWRQNWDAVSPIFKFSTEVRKVILLWSSIFVTLVAKKYHESVTLPSGLRMVYDNH